MSHVEASEMSTRPPVTMICYYAVEGNPHSFTVGSNCTQIREVEEYGDQCYIPWVEVWDGEKLLARFNQHKLEHIFY